MSEPVKNNWSEGKVPEPQLSDPQHCRGDWSRSSSRRAFGGKWTQKARRVLDVFRIPTPKKGAGERTRTADLLIRVRVKLGSGGDRSSWTTRRRFPRKPNVANARRSAESTRRNLDKIPPPPSALLHPIQQGEYTCRASTCSVDRHAKDRCGAVFRSYRTGTMHDPATVLRRIILPRTPVNKGKRGG